MPPNVAEMKCYNCQENGHYANTYNKRRADLFRTKEDKKEKAMMARWGESDSNEDYEE